MGKSEKTNGKVNKVMVDLWYQLPYTDSYGNKLKVESLLSYKKGELVFIHVIGIRPEIKLMIDGKKVTDTIKCNRYLDSMEYNKDLISHIKCHIKTLNIKKILSI